MPETKETVGLIATDIKFTYYSIIYKVKYTDGGRKFNPLYPDGIWACNDIAIKDLNLKPTLLTTEMEVIFQPVYMTPHFYQGLFMKSRKDYNEFKTELRNIYAIGDMVAHIL